MQNDTSSSITKMLFVVFVFFKENSLLIECGKNTLNFSFVSNLIRQNMFSCPLLTLGYILIIKKAWFVKLWQQSILLGGSTSTSYNFEYPLTITAIFCCHFSSKGTVSLNSLKISILSLISLSIRFPSKSIK